MSHLVETMAYVGKVPWHGLGTQVSEDITPQEMVVEAGLDWTVSKRPIMIHDENDYTLATNDWFILVRDTDNRIYGPAGSEYTPFQNEEILDFFTEFCDHGDMTMDTAGSLRDGQTIWALAKMNSGFDLPENDRVENYMLLVNHHQWGKAMSALYTPVRVVCNNTLTVALGKASRGLVHPHKGNFDNVADKIALTLDLANNQAEQFEGFAQKLVETELTAEMKQKFYEEMFGRKKEDGVVIGRVADKIEIARKTSPGNWAKNTLWGMLNGVTYYYDHEYGTTKTTADARLTSSWLVGNAGIKRRAFKKLVEMSA